MKGLRLFSLPFDQLPRYSEFNLCTSRRDYLMLYSASDKIVFVEALIKDMDIDRHVATRLIELLSAKRREAEQRDKELRAWLRN